MQKRDYKETLNLPSTPFPMKANLPVKEKEIIGFFDRIEVYEKLLMARKDGRRFILHDGPPYANGHIHLGTALNKILKDVIVKSKFMAGFRADFVPGWDCHGLPIEHQVEKSLREEGVSVPDIEVRRRCRAYAEKFIEIQKEEFKRLGCIGDWNNPYITMDHDYQATIVEELAKFFERGEVYRRKKPVHWCINCATALAEAEIEYETKRSDSIYVKFPHVRDENWPFSFSPTKPLYMLIWTTTPWTLPANLAIALNPSFTYAAVETQEEVYILVRDLVSALMQKFGISRYRVIEEIDPARLKREKFRHPFLERESVIVYADYVSKDEGTGAVHIAPGHGEEDYETGLQYGLDVLSPVDQRGNFTDDVAFFARMNVFESNRAIVEKLEELQLLLYKEEIEHSYPHCWRCKKPVIFRAEEQWFISLDGSGLRERALKEIDRVEWIPSWGKERIYSMLKVRPDWCISRQRVWGVPITVFYCEACKEPFWSKASFQRVTELVRRFGADVWFEKEAEFFLPEGSKCKRCGGERFTKEKDILDVWFDSGVSFAAVLKKRKDLQFPAHMYLEGSDQHRGWFHSSLLCSCGNDGVAPYLSVLTHGFVVDGQGRKMSKSLGNIISPEEIIERYGAEILRLWVIYEDYREDIRISREIIERLVETYRRIRNTLRFIHGNLYDFDPENDSVPYQEMSFLDRVILSRLQRVIERVRGAYERYSFHAIYHTIQNFCTVDLSSLYLDMIKDRLYVQKSDSVERRATQTVLFRLLIDLLRLLAPVLTFTAEEMWQCLRGKVKEESVLLTLFPEPDHALVDEGIETDWVKVLEVREAVNKKIEEKRKAGEVGHSLEVEVSIGCNGEYLDLLERLGHEIEEILIVSKVNLYRTPTLEVQVSKASGRKCERCWHYDKTVGTNETFPDLCARCVRILGS